MGVLQLLPQELVVPRRNVLDARLKRPSKLKQGIVYRLDRDSFYPL
jgi:hypothetical protein